MGNHVSSVVRSSSKGTIQLIHSDGGVQVLHKPRNSQEILHSFPGHLVCHSDSFYIGQKIPTLSPMEQVKMGHKYFVLPKEWFQSVLSFASLASLISSSKASVVVPPWPVAHNLSMGGTPLPSKSFYVEKDVGGGYRIKVSPELICRLMENGKFSTKKRERIIGPDCTEERLCNSSALQKDYAELVKSRSQVWRPKLETITEKNNSVKRFKIHRRNKSS